MTAPSRDDHAADARVGRGRVEAALGERERARHVARVVVAIGHAGHCRVARRADVSARLARVGAARLPCSASRKSDDVLEAAVHRGEADVARPCRACRAPASPSRRSGATGSRARRAPAPAATMRSTAGRRTRSAPGACAARAGSRRASRVTSKSERVAVRLDDLRQPQLDRLVGREALLAGGAAAAAADRIARLGNARVDDLRVGAAAERALHAGVTVDRETSGVSAATPLRTCAIARLVGRARRARRRSGARAPRIRSR